jgi:hypothetical protein
MRAEDFLNGKLKDVKFRISLPDELVTTQEEVDQFSIKFAEWCTYYRDKNRNVYGDMLHAKSKYDDTYTTKELLEIFKKEKGL